MLTRSLRGNIFRPRRLTLGAKAPLRTGCGWYNRPAGLCSRGGCGMVGLWPSASSPENAPACPPACPASQLSVGHRSLIQDSESQPQQVNTDSTRGRNHLLILPWTLLPSNILQKSHLAAVRP